MATTLNNSRLTTDPMVPRPMRIFRRWDETHDTFSIELDPGPDGFPFVPGQFNMLYVFGIGEVAISISGDPAKRETLTHTIRGVGAVTRTSSKDSATLNEIAKEITITILTSMTYHIHDGNDSVGIWILS